MREIDESGVWLTIGALVVLLCLLMAFVLSAGAQ